MGHPAVRSPGLAAGHRDLPGLVLAHPVDEEDAREPGHHDPDGGRTDTADRHRLGQDRAHQHDRHDDDHHRAFEDRDERTDEVAQRSVAADGAIAHGEDHGLDRDAADEVSGRHVEVALRDRGNGDGDLGQAARYREQDDAAERFAEMQAIVEGCRGPGEGGTREPGGHAADDEDRDERRARKIAHSNLSLRGGRT